MALLLLVPSLAIAATLAPPPVVTVRVPNGGVYPQCQLDDAGELHLIYFKGDPRHGDIFYCTSGDFGRTFTSPVRVNSTPGSALVIGTVRGPQLALGRGRTPQVVWMSSSTEFYYTHLGTDGQFLPQRNLVQQHPGLDGGGSIACDPAGNLYVAWHAPADAKNSDEASRRVWLIKSTDNGASFSNETDGHAPARGACACCNLALFATRDTVYVLYRCATEKIHRDMHLLSFDSDLNCIADRTLATMTIDRCIMSAAAFASSPSGPACAFESADNVYLQRLDGGHPVSPSGKGNNRKHPALAVNASGVILLAWTEDTGWNKGGSVAWQVFDSDLKAIGNVRHAAGLPVWSIPSAFAKPDGSFVIIY